MQLEFFVEEPSAEAALANLVPRILAGKEFEWNIYTFLGKDALLRHLPNRLKAYRHWQAVEWRIIVLVDNDNDDCKELKAKLEGFAVAAGLTTRSRCQPQQTIRIINRIAIEELEAWFFGDIEAIHAAYPRISPDLGKQSPYRDPDAIPGGTWERLEKILGHYHPGGLEKVRAAEEISRHMQPERNRSRSFRVFCAALRTIFE